MYESDYRGYILMRKGGQVDRQFTSYEEARELRSRLIAAAESNSPIDSNLKQMIWAIPINVKAKDLTVVTDGNVFYLKYPGSFVEWFPGFTAAREKLESIAEVYRHGYFLKVVYEPPPQQVMDFTTDVERCFSPEVLRRNDPFNFCTYIPINNCGHSWADSVGEEYHAVWGYDPKFGFTLLSGGLKAIELNVQLGLGIVPVLAKREYHYSDNGSPVFNAGETISESEAFRSGEFSHVLVRRWIVHPWDQRYPGPRKEDTIEWSYWEL